MRARRDSALLTAATFNVWHGLAGRGVVRFREFEVESRRDDRWRLALNEISGLDPDIVFFQELNPVEQKGRDLVQSLGGRFSGRTDQSGIKAFARGLPLNLSTGLGLLVRRHARPARLRDDGFKIPSSIQLSGGPEFSGSEFSLQLHELRYAQMSSVQVLGFGRLLLVNVHLHHGFERFVNLMRLLSEARERGSISVSQVEELLPYLDRARDRRLFEVDRMLEEIEKVSRFHDGILIGGDFNAPREAACYRAMELAGFVDLDAKFGRSEPTWDPIANPSNHRLQQGFEFPLPTFGNEEFQKIYRGFDAIPRRIDYLFARGSLAQSRPEKVARFAVGTNEFAASDHFGVYATWKA